MAVSKIQDNLDYIVEQGTSNNWFYRKWKSGVAECWGEFQSGSAPFTATGNIYYRSISNLAFPASLFTAKPKVLVTVDMENLGGSTLTKASATSFTVGVTSSSASARAINIYVEAKGRWK